MKNHLARREEEIRRFRDKVMDAALILMAREGDWAKVSVNEIAAMIEYTPPNIYHYFKNKEDIQHQIMLRGAEMLKERFTLIARDRRKNPREKLFAVGQQYWNFASRYSEIYSLMFLSKRKKQETVLPAHVQIAVGFIRQIDKKCSDEDAFGIFRSAFCMIHGYICVRMSHCIPIRDKTMFRRQFDEALIRFIAGI